MRIKSLSWALAMSCVFAGHTVAAQEQTGPSAKGAAEAAQKGSPPLAAVLLSRMHAINDMEVRAGRLAQKKATTDNIRDLGERVARDHLTADQKVTAMAAEVGVDLGGPIPGGVPPPMQQMKKMLKQLEQLEGEAFDDAYLKLMTKSHSAAISMLSQKVPQLESEELREMITTMLPILEQHLELSRDLARKEA